jgi:hypothetical protein
MCVLLAICTTGHEVASVQAAWQLKRSASHCACIRAARGADEHPLMSRMHKPDHKLGPEAQDIRSVVPIELEDVDAWLHGTQEQAQALVRLATAEAFDAGLVGR